MTGVITSRRKLETRKNWGGLTSVDPWPPDLDSQASRGLKSNLLHRSHPLCKWHKALATQVSKRIQVHERLGNHIFNRPLTVLTHVADPNFWCGYSLRFPATFWLIYNKVFTVVENPGMWTLEVPFATRKPILAAGSKTLAWRPPVPIHHDSIKEAVKHHYSHSILVADWYRIFPPDQDV